MDASDEKLRSTFVSRRLFIISGKGRTFTSTYRNHYIIEDCLKSHKNMTKQISGGSQVEGVMTTNSDVDTMYVEPFILVVQNPREMIAGHSNILLSNKSFSNPGYTRLQFLDKKPKAPSWIFMKDFEKMFEATLDGLFLSSEKFVKRVLNYKSTSDVTYRRHGPCISRTVNKAYFSLSPNPGQKVNMDNAIAFVCYSWPDEKMEWFHRNRKHDWPSSNLVNKIRREDCHVVPVGDPTSKHPSLDWRFSFLLAERKLVWSFNDTQIQCYFILKLLTKTYINPTVPDEISSYHLKTIVFWQSENLGISAWREDQLLHRVLDCLSYLSKCVQDGRLEHYFYRSNNLLKYKLKNSDDRKFVLDTIKSVENNVTAKVFEVTPERDSMVRVRLRFGVDNVRQLSKFLLTATRRDYEHLKYAQRKYFEHSFDIFLVLLWVTDSLKDADLVQWALTAFTKKPPADVDQICFENYLLCINIRLAIQHYRATLDSSLSEKARKKLTSKSRLIMESGANIDDLVGKLYLATLHFCLKNYSHCENLAAQAVIKRQQLLFAGGSEISSFIASCKPDLKAIHKYIPGFVHEMVKKSFSLVFSKEDADFVPHPLKFECATVVQDSFQLFTIDPFVYAFALLFMAQYLMKDMRLARKYLDHLAEAVYQTSDSYEICRAYNLLGYCYSLDGQRNKAISCYINSLKKARTLPVGITNAALYHLAILCFDIYTETRSD